jgi:exopolysaccharide production protein ExoZ
MIYNLQVLRALAAYLVFLLHFSLYAGPVLPRPDLLTFGAAGVDIFFVLSGFIMFVSTSGRAERPGAFLVRRAARVVPVYWLVTLALALMALAGLRPVGIVEFRPEYLLQSLAFLPFSRGGYIEPLNSVGWTLNYEMFFYAVFAGLLLIPTAAHRALAAAALFLGLILLGLVPMPGIYWAFYTKPIVIEFAFGIGLGYAYERLGAPPAGFPVRRVASLAFLTAALLLLGGQSGAYALGVSPELQGFYRPLVWGSAAVLIVGAMLLLERAGIVLRARWLFAQGNASYSFYLIHNVLLHSAAKIVSVLVTPGIVSAALIFVSAFAAAALLGDLLFRFVEAPASAALRQRYERRIRPASLPSALTP